MYTGGNDEKKNELVVEYYSVLITRAERVYDKYVNTRISLLRLRPAVLTRFSEGQNGRVQFIYLRRVCSVCLGF